MEINHVEETEPHPLLGKMSGFTLPALTDSGNMPRETDTHIVPVAAESIMKINVALRDYSSQTEPSTFISAPVPFSKGAMIKFLQPRPPQTSSTTTTVHVVQDGVDENDLEEGGATSSASLLHYRRSSLVREAARMVEDPDTYSNAARRHDQQRRDYHLRNKFLAPAAAVGGGGGGSMQNVTIRRTEMDGRGTLTEGETVRRRLDKHSDRDHSAQQASERAEMERSEDAARMMLAATWAESSRLAMLRGGAVVEEIFEERLLDTQTDERRQRLDIKLEQLLAMTRLTAVEVSARYIVEYSVRWQRGMDKMLDVLNAAHMQCFIIYRGDAALLLQRVGRGYLSSSSGRAFSGAMRWRRLQQQVSTHYADAAQQLGAERSAMWRRYQLHTLESWEMLSRRRLATSDRGFGGLALLHRNCAEAMLLLGEYEGRRRILSEENNAASSELIPRVVNCTRQDLHAILRRRTALIIERIYASCSHYRAAVATLQRFGRCIVRRELGKSWSGQQVRSAVMRAMAASPVRCVARAHRCAKKQLRGELEMRLLERGDEEQKELQSRQFERDFDRIGCAEAYGRSAILRTSTAALRRTYELCFDQALAAAAGGSERAQVDARHETMMRLYASSPVSSARSSPCLSRLSPAWGEDAPDASSVRFHDPPISDIDGRFHVDADLCVCASIGGKVKLLPRCVQHQPRHLSAPALYTAASPRALRFALAPFARIEPLVFSEPEWYRLRGAVDVAPLVTAAFSHRPNGAASEMFARTIGALLRKRRATSAEMREQLLRRLEAHTIQRLQLETREWSARWLSALQMLEEQSRLLLSMDWQRRTMALFRSCQEDEVAIVQYLATQDYGAYRLQVSEMLRGVHKSVVQQQHERDYVPRFVKRRLAAASRNRDTPSQVAAAASAVVVVAARPRSSSSSSVGGKGRYDCYDEDDDDAEGIENDTKFWHSLLQFQAERREEQRLSRPASSLDMAVDLDTDQGDAVAAVVAAVAGGNLEIVRAASALAASVLDMYDDNSSVGDFCLADYEAELAGLIDANGAANPNLNMYDDTDDDNAQ